MLCLRVCYRKTSVCSVSTEFAAYFQNAADFHATDESGSPLERDVSPDKTDQNKPVPFGR